MLEAVGARVAAASDVDDGSDGVTDRVEEHLIVVPGSGQQVMVEGFRPQSRHEKLAAHDAHQTLLNRQERADCGIRIAIFGCFAKRLDVAQLAHACHAAEIGQTHCSRRLIESTLKPISRYRVSRASMMASVE